jgi:hypothetical protein
LADIGHASRPITAKVADFLSASTFSHPIRHKTINLQPGVQSEKPIRHQQQDLP